RGRTLPTPRRAPRAARALEDRVRVVDRSLERLGQYVFGLVGRGAVRVAVMRREIVDRDLRLLCGRERSEREAPVRDDLRTDLAREARRAAEMVGMRVRDDNGVDVARPEVGLGEPRLQHL